MLIYEEPVRIWGEGKVDNSYCFIRDVNIILSEIGIVYKKNLHYDEEGNEIKRIRRKIDGKRQDFREYKSYRQSLLESF